VTYSLERALPALVRRDVEYGESHAPPIPDTMPDVVAADPGWALQWTRMKGAIDQGALERAGESTSRKGGRAAAERRRNAAEYLAMLGHLEFDLIVRGCAFAAHRYDMPLAWKMCILKQAQDDMAHAAGFIASASRLAEHDYWEGVKAPYQKTIKYYQPILERDLGGFFAAVGLHTEAYPAWTNLAGGSAITDPIVGAWALSEIEDEAWHLSFLYPAIREWLHTGTPEEQERRQRQLVDDNEMLLAEVLAPAHRNAEEYAVGRLGMDPKVLYGYEHVNERTRFIYRSLEIDPSLWPDYLKSVPDLPELAGAYEAVV
jgi:hypothetical protein